MWLVARERIAAGQEIRFDYEGGHPSYWRGQPPDETDAWREARVALPAGPPPKVDEQPKPLGWGSGGDERLRALVSLLVPSGGVSAEATGGAWGVGGHWGRVATHMPGRTGEECFSRWLVLSARPLPVLSAGALAVLSARSARAAGAVPSKAPRRDERRDGPIGKAQEHAAGAAPRKVARRDERRDGPVGKAQEQKQGAASSEKQPQAIALRHVGAASHAAAATGSAQKVTAAAAAEGLDLVRSSNASGYRGVVLSRSRFVAIHFGRRGQPADYLGTFDTAEEAALAYARHVGRARNASQAAGAALTLEAPTAGGSAAITAETAAERMQHVRSTTTGAAAAAAAAEGLELLRSSNSSGYRGVVPSGSRFMGRAGHNGHVQLGTFDTAEEAALAFARHVGKARNASDAAVAALKPKPPTAGAAVAAAAAEKLELVRSNNASGYRGVFPSRSRSRFEAIHFGGRGQRPERPRSREAVYLGTFDTAEEAALAYARHVGKARNASQAAAAALTPKPPTADAAIAAAAAEGLQLVRSNNTSGYKGVTPTLSRFRVREGHGHVSLGTFDTAEEAALAYARHLKGAEKPGGGDCGASSKKRKR